MSDTATPAESDENSIRRRAFRMWLDRKPPIKTLWAMSQDEPKPWRMWFDGCEYLGFSGRPDPVGAVQACGCEVRQESRLRALAGSNSNGNGKTSP